MSSAVANPAFVPIGKAFHITTVEASYSLTMYIIWAAVGPLIAGHPATIVAATICDLYFMHERGFYIGIWTFFLTNGPHTASLIGGFIAQDLGWEWCYTIPGYIQLGTFVITLLALPETLYSRRTSNHDPKSFLDLLLFRATLPQRRIKLKDFLRPLYMGKYLTLFAKNYHFELSQTGLILSVPLLVGSFIGEASTGWFTDWLVSRYAKHHNGVRRPEARLDGLWLSLLVPVGVITQGACIYHHAPWIGAAFGMGLSNLGLQAATTVTYAYTTDYFKPQSAEISCFLNLVRNGFSALISFYAIPLAAAINLQYAWITFALLNVAFLVPVLALKWVGPRISGLAWQAPPSFHNDL
ncbi:hypothetical protein LTR53_011016 [Teratosphaeriaceae sp. CCFEE 6253]|nr:hypothetical protein LTR53_011016 [Teratosphaeriaceae sp. CCFEE 6253]